MTNTAARPSPSDDPSTSLRAVIAQLERLLAELRTRTDGNRFRPEQFPAACRQSADNLLDYLCLRRHELRDLQLDLARWGLSSLGRAEAHVEASVCAALTSARALLARHADATDRASLSFDAGERTLAERTRALLGPAPATRHAHIMVTMPAEAATNYGLVRGLLLAGMNCARINCAHDDATVWRGIVAQIRRAEQETIRECRILMDLAGPKLRTGPVAPGPAVLKIKPHRDSFGRVEQPALIWLSPVEEVSEPPLAVDASLTLPRRWLGQLASNDVVLLRDARAAEREWRVRRNALQGCLLESRKTTYLIPGTRLEHVRRRPARTRFARLGSLPHKEGFIALDAGDLLLLNANIEEGTPPRLSRHGRVLKPAAIGCTLPALVRALRVDDPIWFDDGRIGGIVEALAEGTAHIRIAHAKPGAKLRSDKGINAPRTSLSAPALTEKDLTDLSVVAEHADMVGLSFVNRPADIDVLQAALAQRTTRRVALVLKIETRCAFEHFPELLLTAMRHSACGVMIARGDLAIECGFERLAEVQEELLWLCEAAHVPVIWATQVLDTLAKTGLPSRAEVTDAAMSDRAECVMLNKGPYIVEAVKCLDDILQRMRGHQIKKSAQLRPLHLAQGFEQRMHVGISGVHPQ